MIADPDEDESGEAACGSVGAEWIPAVGGGAGRGVGQPATGRRRLRRCRGGLEASQRSAPRPPGTSDAASRPGAPGCLRSAPAGDDRGKPQPDLVLERVLPLVEAVARRSAYLVLLTENPGALERLLTLCAASPMVAEQIARFPILLDELLSGGRLFRPPQAAELAAELRERLMRIPEDDLEQQVETLRHFKLAHGLRVAASEIAGTLPVDEGQRLPDPGWPRRSSSRSSNWPGGSWCSVTAGRCAPTARRAIRTSSSSATARSAGWSSAMARTSTWCSSMTATPSARPMAANPSMARSSLPAWGEDHPFPHRADAIRHPLRGRHAPASERRGRPAGEFAGRLPALPGAGGWTWEHQALVRARVLAGCRRVQASFEAVRAEVLARPRDLDALRTEVSEMRAKMRDNLGTCATAAGTASNAFEATAAFDLKHDAGGIVDIEFMVQYAVLAWSGEHPALLEFTDNIRILEGLERAGLIASEDVRLLQEAYKAYRAAAHRLALQKEAGVVSGEHFQTERREVIRIWRELRLG